MAAISAAYRAPRFPRQSCSPGIPMASFLKSFNGKVSCRGRRAFLAVRPRLPLLGLKLVSGCCDPLAESVQEGTLLEQIKHTMLPESTHDEAARQDFVLSFKRHVQNEVLPGTERVYRDTVLPNFRRAHGRDPRTRHEVRRAMEESPYYQMSTVLQREGQSMLWHSVLDSVERNLPALVARANAIAQAATRGSLGIDPDFKVPAYIAENHHHLVPGGYAEERVDGDVAAGAVYDRGAYLYVSGYFGPKMDGLGRATIAFLRDAYPGFSPRRILDMGCTTGGSSVALKEAWPKAEVFGIDVGAPCVRYGHARAESFGVAVHFSQQNAEATDFPDGYFDLVVSSAMLHETSLSALHNIVKECHRLLSPGGLMVHSEQPQYHGVGAYEQFVRDWDCKNNAEPFWGTLHDLHLTDLATAAGFAPHRVVETMGPGSADVLDQGNTGRKVTGPPGGSGKVIGRPGGKGMFYFSARKD
ncbi:MAG: class I SAM-dependent methyltransferase [Alphaproteobacteria bacterium]|nr:class I SAM-dependent methyltransferase [Alphaproteobacteria bacterium]